MTSDPTLAFTDLPSPRRRWWGLHNLMAMRRDYLGTIAGHQRLGDLVRLDILRERTLDVFDPELQRRLMVEHADGLLRWRRGPEVFAELMGQSVLVTEGTTWQRQRRMLMPAFAPRRVAGYAALMADAARAGLDGLEPGLAGMDELFSHITMDVILRTLFDVPAGQDRSGTARAAAAVQVLSETAVREMFWPTTLPDWWPLPGKRAKRQARALMRALIQRHLDAPLAPDSRCLLAMLRALRDEETGTALSTQEVFDQCMVSFQAGHETSATALLWWSHLMATHPDVQSRVVQELDQTLGARDPTAEDTLPLLVATLKEAMRLFPPVSVLMTRRLQRDLELTTPQGRVQIPRRTLLRVTPWVNHRDPRCWPQAEAFRPERFLPGAPEIPRGAYLPFGQGPRVCLGQHFAMLEMTLVAAMLLQRWHLKPSGDAPPVPRLAVTLRPAAGLRLLLQRRA